MSGVHEELWAWSKTTWPELLDKNVRVAFAAIHQDCPDLRIIQMFLPSWVARSRETSNVTASSSGPLLTTLTTSSSSRFQSSARPPDAWVVVNKLNNASEFDTARHAFELSGVPGTASLHAVNLPFHSYCGTCSWLISEIIYRVLSRFYALFPVWIYDRDTHICTPLHFIDMCL